MRVCDSRVCNAAYGRHPACVQAPFRPDQPGGLPGSDISHYIMLRVEGGSGPGRIQLFEVL